MIKLIEKRNHELVAFKRDKIDGAVFKALLVSKKSRSQENLKKLSELNVVSKFLI